MSAEDIYELIRRSVPDVVHNTGINSRAHGMRDLQMFLNAQRYTLNGTGLQLDYDLKFNPRGVEATNFVIQNAIHQAADQERFR